MRQENKPETHGDGVSLTQQGLPKPQGLTHLIPDNLRDRFLDSAWCSGAPGFSKVELDLAYELLQVVGGEVRASNVSLFIHLQTTARCARVLAERFNHALSPDQSDRQLNLEQVEALAIIHDLGRFTTHSWYINDILLHDLLQYLHVDLQLRGAVLWPDDSFSPSQKFTDLQSIVMIADMLSKVDLGTGSIKSIDEAIRYHEESRGTMRPRTDYRLEARRIAQFQGQERRRDQDPSLSGLDLTDAWADLYRDTVGWLRHMGIDLESVQREILQSPPAPHEKPIVVFNLGGVVSKLRDDRLKRDLATAFGITIQQLSTVLDNKEMLASVQSGGITETEWCNWIHDQLFTGRSTQDRNTYVARIQRALGNLHIEPVEEVIEFAEDLKKQGFTVVALSDTIPGHISGIRQRFEGVFERVFCSPEIGVSTKSEKGYLVFWVALATLGVDKKCSGFTPKNVVFVDDREDCRNAADTIGIKTFSWEENPAEQRRLELIAELRRLLTRSLPETA